MSGYFCLSVTFLSGTFHGRSDGGQPEWPPSPLRVFQALMASAARRWRGVEFVDRALPALRWLESQDAPAILAPPARIGQPIRLSVPNNAMDIVARAWSRGNYSGQGDANPARHQTMKTVRPTHLVGGDQIHLLWPHGTPPAGVLDVLTKAAAGMAVLGWGLDLVIGHARAIAASEIIRLSGQRWRPVRGFSEKGLRVPVAGSADALSTRHEAFVKRLANRVFTPVPPLSAYRKCEYVRELEPDPRPAVAFQLLKLDVSGFQPYSPMRRTHVVSAMMRRATAEAAEKSGWPADEVARCILGHGDGPNGQACDERRFAYLPLPSIENRKGRNEQKTRVVSDIRRILLAEFPTGSGERTAWAQRGLAGRDLVPDPKDSQTSPAILSVLPANDWCVTYYTRCAATWSTVTPVLLPGYDDPGHLRRRIRNGENAVSPQQKSQYLARLDNRIDRLIRKAIVQAGYPSPLAAHAQVEWRNVGFWQGVDLASRFQVPKHLNGSPRYHVRIRWRDETGEPIEVKGPICFGAGRFYGLGLFAAES